MMKEHEKGIALMGVGEVANLLGIKKRTLYEYTRMNKIGFIKFGSLIKFRDQDVQSFIEAHYVKTEAN